ncbi:MAG TPA: hypothetical protein VFT15_02345, partial [Chitinophagaceae bacterium]|nr:hypothetical protein [Chitinophagaceae bacterium]
MRILFICILIIGNALLPAYGQHENFKDVPGLLQNLSAATTDTARVMFKSRLAEAYRSNDPDTSLILASEALSGATKLGFKKGEIHALVALCVLAREKGDLPNALELGLKALKMSEEEHLAYEQIYALVRVAIVYISVRDFPKAIDYLKKAESLLKDNPDAFQRFAIHYFLASAYEQSNDLEAAEKQMFEFEKDEPGVVQWIVVSKRLRAYIAVKRNQLPLALQYYRESNVVAIAENGLREVA